MQSRLYLVTPPSLAPDFPEALKAALDAADIACLRLEIAAPEADIRRAADRLRPICDAGAVTLVIAEHWRLVGPHGLDGVHLPAATPASIRSIRKSLGRDATIGAFAGASRHKGMGAGEAGADYVSLGPVAAGALGDGAEAGDDLFDWWEAMIETPSVAEGGMSLERARALAGRADFIAARMSVWDAPEGPAAALGAYAAALGG